MKRIALPILLASALLSQLAQAATTPVVGYYKVGPLDPGAYPLSVGFTAKKDYQGAMTGTAVVGPNTEIQQTGVTLPALTNHYVEILTSAVSSNVGLILDVVSNGAGSIIVQGLPTLAAGDTYAVRKHVTLGSLLGDSSDVQAGVDLVVILDSAGNEITATYDGAGIWKDVVTTADISDTVLYPGQGFLFLAGDVRTLTIGGSEISHVKDGDTRISLPAGIPALVGLINPLVSYDVLDPIYATTATNTLTEFGLRADPPVAGLGMTADSDLAVLLTADGVADTVHNILLDGASNNLVDAITTANINNVEIRNGNALLYIPAGDLSFVIPQRH